MTIGEELRRLRETDVWSFVLFALFKMQSIPEYSTLSELVYILDRDSMLRFCEYFGGMTIKVPTIKELESLVRGLTLYQYLDVEKRDYKKTIKDLKYTSAEEKEVREYYEGIKKVLEDYKITSRMGS